MVLQSDALIYGSQSAATFATTQQMFKDRVCPNCTTLADFRALPVSSILWGQNAVRVDSFQNRPGTPLSGRKSLWPHVIQREVLTCHPMCSSFRDVYTTLSFPPRLRHPDAPPRVHHGPVQRPRVA